MQLDSPLLGRDFHFGMSEFSIYPRGTYLVENFFCVVGVSFRHVGLFVIYSENMLFYLVLSSHRDHAISA